jgi:starch synthase
MPNASLQVWLVHDALFDRPGNSYCAADGLPWPDNVDRFALFSRAIVAVAIGRTNLDWGPDVLRCNGWQTALAHALLAPEPRQPVVVYTI